MSEGAFNPERRRILGRMQVIVAPENEQPKEFGLLTVVDTASHKHFTLKVGEQRFAPNQVLDFVWQGMDGKDVLTGALQRAGALQHDELPVPSEPPPLVPEQFTTPTQLEVPTKGSEEADEEGEPTEEVAERLPEELPVPREIERPKDIHTIEFEGQQCVVREGTSSKRILNAKEAFLLPGDEVRIETKENDTAIATDIRYGGRSTILGRFEYRGRRPGEDESRERELNFVVRLPGEGGDLDKFRFRVGLVANALSKEEFEQILARRAYIRFDRETRKIVGAPIPEEELPSYDAACLSVLTNLGIQQHSEEQQDLMRGETEQVQALQRTGLKTMRQRIAEDIAHGTLEDRRDKKGFVVAVDFGDTLRRDDAFYLGPSPRGVEWYEVGLLVADLRTLVPAGSAIDRGAAERSTDLFIPKGTKRLYPGIIKALGSLNEGRERRTLSLLFSARVGPDGDVEIQDIRFAPTVQKITDAMSREKADELLASEDAQKEGTVANALSSFVEIMDALNQRGVIRKGDTPQPLEDIDDAIKVANLAFNRATAEGFKRLKRSGLTRLHRLQELVLGSYLNNYFGRNENAPRAEQSTTPRGNVQFGANYSYVTSPLRDYSSLIGLRALGFLIELQRKATQGKDLSRNKYRSEVLRYARDVVGIEVTDEMRQLSNTDLTNAVAERSREYLDETLKHCLAREKIIHSAQDTLRTMKLLDSIGKRMLEEKGPVKLEDELVVSFPFSHSAPVMENGVPMVYAEAVVGPRRNKEVYRFGPRKTPKTTIGIKFELPKDMPFPKQSSEMRLSASVVDVEVEQNRLVLKVTHATPIEPPPPRTRRRRRRRRPAAR